MSGSGTQAPAWTSTHAMSSLAPTTSRVGRLVAATLHARRRWQVLLALLVAVVLYLALSPMPPREVTLGWDKFNHAAAFTALTIAGCFAFGGSRRGLLLMLLGVFALGGAIELLQLYVPGRSSEWEDLLADAVGMVAGLAVALPLRWLATGER
jgi:VanZ family protein